VEDIYEAIVNTAPCAKEIRSRMGSVTNNEIVRLVSGAARSRVDNDHDEYTLDVLNM